MIQDTSIKAYKEDALPTLCQRQNEVLEALESLGQATNSEIAQCLGWSINRVTPRVFELREAKKVIEVDKRPCKITGRKAYAWTIKPNQQSLI